MRQVKKGSINVSVDVYIIDSTTGVPELGVLWNTAGMDMEYRRESAAVVNITEATLAALTTAHADGGFLEIGHGLYRLDVPDAAFATGAETVSIQGTVTGMIVLPQTIQLVAFDPEDGVRLGLTALPNAAADAAGGLPISDAGGLDIDAKLANTNEVTVARMGALTDLIDAGRLDAIFDAIKAKTDNLPTDPADQSLIIAATNAIVTDLDDIKGTGFVKDTHSLVDLEAFVDGIESDLSNGTDGLGALKALIDALPQDKTGYALSAAGTLAIWHEAVANIVTASTIGKLLKDEITSARMAVLTDWIDAGRLDALLDAIKVVTDKFVFTVANIVDANMLRINGNADSPVILDRAVRSTTRFTIGAASTLTNIVTSSMDPAAAAIDQFKGLVLKFDKDTTTANLRSQGTDITGNTAAGVLTVTALTTAPVSGDTGTIA